MPFSSNCAPRFWITVYIRFSGSTKGVSICLFAMARCLAFRTCSLLVSASPSHLVATSTGSKLSAVMSSSSLPHQPSSQSRPSSSLSTYLVSPQQLNDALNSDNDGTGQIIPLCGAWFMPNDAEGRKGIDAFRKNRIPNARFFDLDAVKDPDSPYPHMLPTCEAFAEGMGKMGIHRDDTIVVYDTEELGIFSAPRVGWTLRVFGHPKVHVLNNYRLWVRERYPVETGEPAPVEKSKYPVPNFQSQFVVTFTEMKDIAKDNLSKGGVEDVEILDARSHGRWSGADPEPRAGLSSGHIPGSTSLPFQELLDPETKAFLPKSGLEKVFQAHHVDPSKTIISTCGTGVTASIIETALAGADYGDALDRRVYDGSWT